MAASWTAIGDCASAVLQAEERLWTELGTADVA
jgi:hypothetical protein